MRLFDTRLQDAKPDLVFLRWIPGWAIELWIALVLITFLLIRVLGSGTGQRILNFLGVQNAG